MCANKLKAQVKWINLSNRNDWNRIKKKFESLTRPIISKEIGLVFIKLPTKKSSGPNDFMSEFYCIFKEELIPIIHNFSQKYKRKHPPTHLTWRQVSPWHKSQSKISKGKGEKNDKPIFLWIHMPKSSLNYLLTEFSNT